MSRANGYSEAYLAPWTSRHLDSSGRFQMGQLPETAGALVQENLAGQRYPAWKTVTVGVATGVSIWALTRILDRMFGISGSHR